MELPDATRGLLDCKQCCRCYKAAALFVMPHQQQASLGSLQVVSGPCYQPGCITGKLVVTMTGPTRSLRVAGVHCLVWFYTNVPVATYRLLQLPGYSFRCSARFTNSNCRARPTGLSSTAANGVTLLVCSGNAQMRCSNILLRRQQGQMQ